MEFSSFLFALVILFVVLQWRGHVSPVSKGARQNSIVEAVVSHSHRSGVTSQLNCNPVGPIASH
jgi:hypothetical protein